MPYLDFRDIIMPHCSGLFRFLAGQSSGHTDGSCRRSYEHDLKIITHREPFGIVAEITPFNFPMALTCSKIAPALAAGNTVVHKPVSDTPLKALALAQVALDAGVPEGVYNLITGPGGKIGGALVQNPQGRQDRLHGVHGRRAGDHPQRCRDLEVPDHGAWRQIAELHRLGREHRRRAAGCLPRHLLEQGEVCVAGSRILVERSISDEFAERLAKIANAAVMGDPLDPEIQIGPMACKAGYDKVPRYVEDGKQPARPVAGCGTRQIDGKGLFIEATEFAGATNDIKISLEEIFGPVVPVILLEDEDDAIRLANDTPYGLASSIQTGDMARALRPSERIKTGTVRLNTWHAYHPNAPFGGFKLSGCGREQGAEAVENYTQYKTVRANLAHSTIGVQK